MASSRNGDHSLLSSRANAVVAHQIPAAKTYGHRLAAQTRDGRAGPLRVDMQVRLARIAAVTDETEHVAALRERQPDNALEDDRQRADRHGRHAASYEVRFSFQGHLGSLASAPDCPVRRDGKAVMSGILAGVETVPEGDDIAYRGVLRLEVDLDLCEVARRRGRRASSERRPTAPAGRRQTTKN